MIIAGKYEVLETIGKGGMGTVYKARQKNLDRMVAIKMLSEELASDHEFRARFQQEATVVARLNHPNIVQVHDIEPHGETFCIIMEYVEGENLQSKIDRDVTLGERDAVLIGAQVARALDYAHRHGIIHRDIKPDNIHVTSTGVAKVMDFGIARFADSTLKTQTGISMGTPKFMSPEQVTGKNVDGQTDLYSLGICLYYCVAGRPPFDGENAISVATRHLYEQPELPSKINSSISLEVEAVIMKALEKQKPNRYRTGIEMAEALDATLGISVPVPDEAAVSEAYAGVTQRMAVGQYGVELTASDFAHDAVNGDGDVLPIGRSVGPHVSPLTVRTLPRAEELTPSRPVDGSNDPTRSFKLSLKVLLGLVAFSAIIIVALVFVLRQGNGATAPREPGLEPTAPAEDRFRDVATKAADWAGQGKVGEAYRLLRDFKQKNPGVAEADVSSRMAALEPLLPVTETEALAARRRNQGFYYQKKQDDGGTPMLAIAYAYLKASAKLGSPAGFQNTARDLLAGKLAEPPTAAQEAEARTAYGQAVAELKADRTREAEQLLLKAANSGYRSAVYWEALGDFYKHQNQVDDARVMYGEAVEFAADAENRVKLTRKLDEVNG